MTTIEHYRQLAEHALLMSDSAADEAMRAVWLKLASGYRALAEHAARNSSHLGPLQAPSLAPPDPAP